MDKQWREDGVSSLCKLTAHPGQRGLRFSSLIPLSFFFSSSFSLFSWPVPLASKQPCKKFHHPSSSLDSPSTFSPFFSSIAIDAREKFQTDSPSKTFHEFRTRIFNINSPCLKPRFVESDTIAPSSKVL